jgi:hypothetical protein
MCVSAEWRSWEGGVGVGLEQLSRAPIRQPGGAVRCAVEHGGCGPGWPAGGEHRAGAAFQQSGKQRGGAGRPGDPLDLAALAGHAGAAVGEVEVGDVEREDLAGAGGRLVQHAPQRLVPQRRRRGEDLLYSGAREGAGGVGPDAPVLKRGQLEDGAVPLQVAHERADDDSVPVQVAGA